ncbi:MAG TPA: YceI family protein [Chitinophagaceae bacterium]|jgi:polyisoprenoid-binding protein YceI|nr:YceI family protein [Chitinophagaceae bacterium]
MKLKQCLMLSLIVTVLPFAANWKADTANAKVDFTVKGPFGTVHGSFSGLKATIKFDEKDLAGSELIASIDVKTVSTGVGLRNKDLRNKDIWFNAAKFPMISFKSKKIRKTASGFSAMGDLTIKGITKEIEIPFTFTGKGDSGIFKGQFHINRQEYKVGNKGGSVGDDITINLEVPTKK